MGSNKKMVGIISIIVIILAGLCSYYLGNIFSDNKTYDNTYKYLDKKQEIVTKLVAASAGSSTVIAIMPGDSTTPIANQIASISKYLMVVMIAVLLEKLLVSIIGSLVFRWIIPIGIIFILFFWILKKQNLQELVSKIVVASILIFAIIPLSCYLGEKIENTSEIRLEEKANELANQKMMEEKLEIEAKENKKENNFLWDIHNYFQSMLSNTKNSIKGKVNEIGMILNTFIEEVVVLIITTCIIPILILMGIIGIIKIMFSIEISPKPVIDFITKDTFKPKATNKKDNIKNKVNKGE